MPRAQLEITLSVTVDDPFATHTPLPVAKPLIVFPSIVTAASTRSTLMPYSPPTTPEMLLLASVAEGDCTRTPRLPLPTLIVQPSIVEAPAWISRIAACALVWKVLLRTVIDPEVLVPIPHSALVNTQLSMSSVPLPRTATFTQSAPVGAGDIDVICTAG